MVEQIPIVDKVPKFVDVRLFQDLLRGANSLSTHPTERPQKLAGRKMFWISHTKKSLKAGANSRRYLAFILATAS